MESNLTQVLTNLVGILCGASVGLIIYVFTAHLSTTSKRIDARAEENQKNEQQLNQLKEAITRHDEKLNALEKNYEKLEKNLLSMFERLENKIDKITDSLNISKPKHE